MKWSDSGSICKYSFWYRWTWNSVSQPPHVMLPTHEICLSTESSCYLVLPDDFVARFHTFFDLLKDTSPRDKTSTCRLTSVAVFGLSVKISSLVAKGLCLSSGE